MSRKPVAARGGRPAKPLVPDDNALRYAAELYYTCDVMHSGSVRELSQQPQFAHLSLRTLERWATEDRWVAKRRDKIALYRQAIEERLHDQIVDQQVAGLRELSGLYERALRFAMSPDGPPAKSFEGAARVALNLAEHLHQVRLDLAAHLHPKPTPVEDDEDERRELAQSAAPVPDQMLPVYTQDEALLVAHSLMEHRQLKAAPTLDAAALQAARADAAAADAVADLDDDVEDVDGEGFVAGEDVDDAEQ